MGDGVSGVCVAPATDAGVDAPEDSGPDSGPLGTCKRRVVFSDSARAPDGNLAPAEIWVANVDGTGLTNLSNYPSADDNAPSWSPNGLRIAFVSNRTGRANIFAINPDGTGLANLSTGAASADSSPVWSPDGTRIAFFRDDHVWVMNANGTGAAQVTELAALQFAWSPSGTKLAFARYDAATNFVPSVYVVTIGDGSAPLKLTSPASREGDVAWAPNSKIVFTNGVDIFAADDDGANLLNITKSTGLSRRTGDPLSVGASGLVAFDSDHGNGSELWTVPLDGGSVKPLVMVGRPNQESFMMSDVSDDGLLVAYRHDDQITDTTTIGVINIDGTDAHIFGAPSGADAFGARFSPKCESRSGQ